MIGTNTIVGGAPVLQEVYGVPTTTGMVETLGAPMIQTIGAPQMVGTQMVGTVEQSMLGGTVQYGAPQVIGGGNIIGTQVFETTVPEVVQTTGAKWIEVPQMVVTKQMVPEVI